MENKKKTSDYSQGKIYKIVCNKTGRPIGSTCEQYNSVKYDHNKQRDDIKLSLKLDD